MNINEMSKISHTNAKEKGWWDQPKSLPELICLVHSELSEVLEEVRNGKHPNETYYSGKKKYKTSAYNDKKELMGNKATITIEANSILSSDKVESLVRGSEYIETRKPEGVPSELADVVIRIGDICGYYGIDLEAAIKEKLEYNKSRSYRHGNKVL